MRNFSRILSIMALSILALTLSTLNASGDWHWRSNGYGWPASAWCSVTSVTGNVASAGAKNVASPTASIPAAGGFTYTAPLPAGSNPGTYVQVSASWGWSGWWSAVANGGDDFCTPSSVTASSPSSSQSGSVSGSQTSSSTVVFSINWSGSDPGEAACINIVDTGTSPPTVLQSLSVTGPWSSSSQITVTAATTADNIVVYSSGVGYSLPLTVGTSQTQITLP